MWWSMLDHPPLVQHGPLVLGIRYMPKESRKLGVDRPNAPKVYQGVVAPSDFPKAKLDVSLDSILADQEGHDLNQESDAILAVVPGNAEFMEVPVDLIDPSPYQPRIEITDEELQLLANSISVARRVNRPISLRIKPNGRYELIGGERRWRSVQLLGWDKIISRILDVDDAEAQVLALADNEGQEGLTDFERGRAYKQIMDRGEVTSIRNLASRVGVSHQSVMRCLNLTKLPQDCIDFLNSHPRLLGSTLASEYAAAGEAHPGLVLEALQKIDQEGISQEQGLRWIKQVLMAREKTALPSSTQVRPVTFAGGLEGSLVASKSGFRITVPKGVDLEKVERAILSALQSE